jgi:hypothetical protein
MRSQCACMKTTSPSCLGSEINRFDDFRSSRVTDRDTSKVTDEMALLPKKGRGFPKEAVPT